MAFPSKTVLCAIGSCWCLSLSPSSHGALRDNPELGLRVADDLEVSLYAGLDLAENSYSSTIDSRGRVVVSGPGYIRVLHDTDNDGRADNATLFAETRSGAMGLCFDGDQLLYMADGAIWRLRDANQDDKADAAAERILTVATGEHGGHALRKGPDGWWYFIGGNDAKFSRAHLNGPGHLIEAPEGGAILRLSPDFQTRSFIVEGMRNAYDFDFHAAGDIFTYDSDVERDFLLPWYTPTRVDHLAFGAHHGWRLPGYLRSWKRPDHYSDVAESLVAVGRGSPTGVTVYRHTALTQKYHGGFFALDWTFGDVWFFPLTPSGSSYRSKGEIVLQPLGSEGFAPNDISVGPEGDLFISIGGRKTRGAVYRVAARRQQPAAPASQTDLARVLEARQPLDAWSRAKWVPLARQLGPAPFLAAITDDSLPTPARIRAVELHRELFGPFPASTLTVEDNVLARVLWGVDGEAAPDVWKFVGHQHPGVARAAIERLLALKLEGKSPAPANAAMLTTALGSTDRRVRLAAISLARLVGNDLEPDLTRPRSALGLALAQTRDKREQSLRTALALLSRNVEPDLHLDCLRVILLAGEDWNLHKPSVEIYTSTELATDPGLSSGQRTVLLNRSRELLGSTSSNLRLEAARILAIFYDASPESLEQIARFITPGSSAVDDFHYLICISRLTAPWPAPLVPRIADAMVGLDQKLGGREHRSKQNWAVRRNELLEALVAREPKLAETLVNHPGFITAGHVPLALALPEPARRQAAAKFLAKAQDGLAYTAALGELLSLLPEAAEFIRANRPAPLAKRAAATNNPALAAEWSNAASMEGDVERGRALYRLRACESCHDGASAIGPDLTGVAARLSMNDLFRAIAYPDESVSEAYQAQRYELKDGQTHVGLVAFLSADGVIIQTGPGLTVRINEDEIASRGPAETSLMPAGLLDELAAAELADLQAYLKSLGKAQPAP